MSRVLDLAVGLTFTYLLLASAVTATNELIAWFMKRRASNLREGIVTLLNNQQLADAVYNNPIIKSLSHGKRDPAYIPTELFASVLTHELTNGSGELQSLQTAAANIPALKALLDKGVTSVEEAKDRIGAWFDASMDRLSGAYKRNTHLISALLALFLSLVLNVDSLRVAKALWADPALRAEIVKTASEKAKAQQQAATGQPTDEEVFSKNTAQLRTLADEAGGLGLPIGWSKRELPADLGEWALRILGLLATAFAVSLGAPFWFDLLNRIGSIRSAGPKPS